MSQHKVTLILVKNVELSDPDDPESSPEMLELLEDFEDDGWIVEIRSAKPVKESSEELVMDEDEDEDEDEEDE